ncbi:MAG: ATP-binding protein [Anaerolineaceae bacterium]|nr:ATP-binding protein [Anaerolineaceae bacterium]
MSENGHKNDGYQPSKADVSEQVNNLQNLADDEGLIEVVAQGEGAIAFVHFDPSSAKSNVVEALVHHDDVPHVNRGMYVHILSADGRRYSGRIIEGPFYNPDALKRDSTPVQFIILHQGRGKTLAVPEYHAWVQIEILGEEKDGQLLGAIRRPRPASPIIPYDTSMMEDMMHLTGDIVLGLLDNYEEVFVRIDENDKGVVPRNWLTVGTVGSGKSNTTQVFTEETLRANYAQIIVDPEGEYIFMDKPTDQEVDLALYKRARSGVKQLRVYRPPKAQSQRTDAIEFSVPFSSLHPDVIMELAEMSPAQQTRFTFLYEQATQCLRKDKRAQGKPAERADDDLDLSRGYPGITLKLLRHMLDEEFGYWDYKKKQKEEKNGKSKTKTEEEKRQERRKKLVALQEQQQEDPSVSDGMKIYCHTHNLPPLLQDSTDVTSYGALRKKLRELDMMGIFDRQDAPQLDMEILSHPGQLTVIDMSDAHSQQVVNIVIADLLARMYEYKMQLTEEANVQRKVIITIEEAHGFISRERQDKMEQTLDQLRRIARRGRKRWLALHFVTQSPQHLPSELFELANNKIIHQTTGSENLRVLKAAAGSVNEGIWGDVPSLGRGRAVIVSSQYPHPIIARIRPAASKRNYTT